MLMYVLVHDAVFRQAEQDWFKFVEKLIERLSEIDETVPELPVKDVVSRAVEGFDVSFCSTDLMDVIRSSAYTVML